MVGTNLGQYRIGDKLGEGGMGAVYRATDTVLKRQVAVKVLPPAVASDPERLARFQREAELLAALNHPHIAAIYGLERSGETTALVMELVEGEDLSQIIARGATSPADALPIAKQIAEALETAHEQGIIHRDLKPANIKVRTDGAVKVLDFGLAKALAAEGAEAASNATMTSPAMTQAGVILGTAAYMSPEQAKGKAVDRRADIWAFGVVLYELLTGRQAFAGDSITEILGAVVLKDPDWSALPATVSPRLRELLLRCLQKDPRTRQRDMGDVTLELGDIVAGKRGSPAVAAAPVQTARSRALIAAALVGVAAIGVAIGWRLTRTTPTPPAPTARFIVVGPDESGGVTPVLTPDGKVLVFVAKGQLYKRAFDGFAATPMAGTEGARALMVSPNGRWVAFFADGKIKKVSLSGGDPTAVVDANKGMPGAAWFPDDTIVFSRGWATGLSAVPASGGEIRQLTEPDRAQGERGHWRARPLPGGQHLLFTIMMAGSGVNDSRIAVLDLKTGRHRALFPGTDGEYLQSGHILYFHAGAWHVVPFDAATEKTTGDPVTVLDDATGVSPDGGNADRPLWVSDTGTLAYMPGPKYPKRELVWMDRAGKIESLGLPSHALEDAALSPDGRRIALSRMEGGTFELWMDDVERKTEDRLDIKGSNFSAAWSPHSDTIAFVSERKGEYDAYTSRPDGSNVQPLLTKDFDEQPLAWMHDGRRLIDKEWRPDGSTPIMVTDTGANNAQELLLPQSDLAGPFRVSPDDHWLLYAAFATGVREVYVRQISAQGTTTRVSRNGGGEPLWSPAGNEIFFRQGETVVSVSFRQDGGRVVIGAEQSMFALPSTADFYDVAPDGRRFLVGRLTEPPPPPGIRVVLNWFEELKKR